MVTKDMDFKKQNTYWTLSECKRGVYLKTLQCVYVSCFMFHVSLREKHVKKKKKPTWMWMHANTCRWKERETETGERDGDGERKRWGEREMKRERDEREAERNNRSRERWESCFLTSLPHKDKVKSNHVFTVVSCHIRTQRFTNVYLTSHNMQAHLNTKQSAPSNKNVENTHVAHSIVWLQN